ncbi:zinc finger and BTB domain-containing protein 5 [Grus japonensis]|uniref:Zinc finger and BTB domain-containing protein 5 n=1 Tax=Grus japonensis TaxID=30415 RepID=A0ABC9Y5G0_GRUJA
MEVHSGAEIPLLTMENTTLEQEEVPEGGCDTVGSAYWSRLLAGPMAPWRAHTGAGLLAGLVSSQFHLPTLEQSSPEGLYTVEEAHFGAVCEEQQPV